jgi:transcriptional regulator GlxA family with amidase domain
VRIVVFPDFQLLDATGPAQVFATANDELGRAVYNVRLVSQPGGLVRSSSGVAVDSTRWPTKGSLRASTLIAAGGLGVDAAMRDPGLRKRLAAAQPVVRRCCSVCSGAFLLAGAGLLDGRRAVTHWRDVEQFRRLFPKVRLHDDAIHVKDGAMYTSAGVTAGIDLCLSLVEEDHGRALALRVAKRLVVHFKRSGGQRQFSAELLAQSAEQGVAAELSAWLRPRLRQRVAVDDMAAALAVSSRSLHRRLRDELSTTPAKLLAGLRLEAACQLLEAGRASLKDVARRTGFQSEYNLRRAFQQRLGVAPSDYKARFG